MKQKKYTIPFNRPHLSGRELKYIKHAHSLRQLAGDGFYTKKCQEWIKNLTGTKECLLTHSCTGALEMMAILSRIEPDDEVIIPDFTFVSTANAFVLRRGKPVFVDIHPDTLNIDEREIEKAITPKTKAIVTVHYAGISCDMDPIVAIAKKYKLLVLEDAAQGFMSTYKGQPLGTIGDMGAYSFHETKNVISGEGGAILLNNKKHIERAKIIREKGTNRSNFFLGMVDKYTWVDIGSSYLPGEIIASFLMAQLEKANLITKKRKILWNQYHTALESLEKKEYIRRPVVPNHTNHNGHLYYILARNAKDRDGLIAFLKKRKILMVTHYVPLHSSPGGRKFGRYVGSMKITNQVNDRLIRLPLFYDLKKDQIDSIVGTIHQYYRHH